MNHNRVTGGLACEDGSPKSAFDYAMYFDVIQDSSDGNAGVQFALLDAGQRRSTMPGFTDAQWQKIETELKRNPAKYGKPVRRPDSVLLGSFNALKLGKARNTDKRWKFLTSFISRFDLMALQEVMDDLSGLRRLHQSLGDEFQLVVSDTTGAFPGDGGVRERLAFLYRPSRIQRGELVSDISYDRSKVVRTLRDDIDEWSQFFVDIVTTNEARKQEGKKPKPFSKFVHPAFSTFMRTPHCASFSILPRKNADPVEFLAVNAHLLFGNDRIERVREFEALLGWLVRRAKARERMYHRNMILFGDLNLEFDSNEIQLSDITRMLFDLNSTFLSGSSAARANFPFLDVHPKRTSLFASNARKDQTFDHIAFFIDRSEKGLPKSNRNLSAGQHGADAYDYGVFDFVELFSKATRGVGLQGLSKSERTDLFARTATDVSDHMPVWVRIPVPGAG